MQTGVSCYCEGPEAGPQSPLGGFGAGCYQMTAHVPPTCT